MEKNKERLFDREFNILDVKVGDVNRKFVIAQTTALKNYDGFGTLEIREDNGIRDILIDRENFDWQYHRYQSGLRGCVPSELDRDAVSELIWSRINLSNIS